MGGSIAKLFSFFWAEEIRLMFFGLDSAGKTTMLFKFKLGEVVTTIPTIGFNVETISYKGINLTAWDLGGREKARALWRHYTHNMDAVVYIVDSADHQRMGEARAGLEIIHREADFRHMPVLVMANKQDVPTAVRVPELTEVLSLHTLLGPPSSRQWHIQAAAAVTGDGLYEGLDWLCEAIKRRRSGEWRPTESAAAAVNVPGVKTV